MENFMALLVDMIACLLCKNRYVWLGLFCVCFLSCANDKISDDTLPFYNSATFDAEWIDAKDAAYKNIHTIDTFALQNQLGDVITKDSLQGKIYVANFFFTTCTSICPKMAVNFASLQDSFVNNDDVKLVSFTVMPWVDSVAQLKKYALTNNVQSHKWHLLTGNKECIYNLARTSYFAEKTLGTQKTTNEFLHTETMLLIDKQGRIRGIYNATQKVDVGRVAEDIRILMAE
jgi:protein SCO1